jgi:predicted Rdx family selenoprotein
MIKKATGVDVEIVEGRRGEFTIWVGETMVAQKDDDLGFPSDEDVIAAVRSALNLP